MHYAKLDSFWDISVLIFSQKCTKNLLIDRCITQNYVKYLRNLSMAWMHFWYNIAWVIITLAPMPCGSTTTREVYCIADAALENLLHHYMLSGSRQSWSHLGGEYSRVTPWVLSYSASHCCRCLLVSANLAAISVGHSLTGCIMSPTCSIWMILNSMPPERANLKPLWWRFKNIRGQLK